MVQADVFYITHCSNIDYCQLAVCFREENMTNQPRVAKVLAALLVSMTIGAMVLLSLGNTPSSSGAFCLSSYYRLNAVEKAILSQSVQSPGRWNCIEVFYSNTKAGNVEQLASLRGLSSSQDVNFHFCVCNGFGGNDGEILATERWQRQWSIIPGGNWYGTGQTIRICVIADGETMLPSDSQVKRTHALIESLTRKFNIQPKSIYFPGDWR